MNIKFNQKKKKMYIPKEIQQEFRFHQIKPYSNLSEQELISFVYQWCLYDPFDQKYSNELIYHNIFYNFLYMNKFLLNDKIKELLNLEKEGYILNEKTKKIRKCINIDIDTSTYDLIKNEFEKMDFSSY